MKIRHFAGIIAAAFCIGTAVAQPGYYYPEGMGPYFRADIGPAFFPDGRLTEFGGTAGNPVRYETGIAADAALGYAFNPNIAADFEFGAIGAKIDSVPGFVSDNSRLYYVPFLGNLTISLPIP